VSEIEVHFIGHLAEQDTRILKTAMLKGLLSVVGQDMVNYVNANHYAEQRGISVTENKRVESTDYVSLMVVVAKAGEREFKLGATLMGKKNEPRVVVFNDFAIDMAPSHHMLFLEYTDVPGVVGKVGTALGENGINIASMQVGRTGEGGTALMGINVDSAIPDALMERINAKAEVSEAWSVEL
jgi:D-3-phosphoglycerate dehydrogenase